MNSTFRYPNDDRPTPDTRVSRWYASVPSWSSANYAIVEGGSPGVRGKYKYNETTLAFEKKYLDNKPTATVGAGTAEFTTPLDYEDSNILPWVSAQPYIIGDIVGPQAGSGDYFELVASISGADLIAAPNTINKWKKIKTKYAIFAPNSGHDLNHASHSFWYQGNVPPAPAPHNGMTQTRYIIFRIPDAETATEAKVMDSQSILSQAQIDTAVANEAPEEGSDGQGAAWANGAILACGGTYYLANGAIAAGKFVSDPAWIPLGREPLPSHVLSGSENEAGATIENRTAEWHLLHLSSNGPKNGAGWVGDTLNVDLGITWSEYKYSIDGAGAPQHNNSGSQSTPDLDTVKGEFGYYGNDKKGHYANSHRPTLGGSPDFDATFQYPNSSVDLQNT